MRIAPKLVAGAAVVASTVLAVPAFAAGPYTVKAGTQTTGTTSFTSVSGPIQFNTSAGLQLTCDAGSTANGTLNLGTNATGTGIASITSSNFKNCVGPLGIPLNVTQQQAWRLNATGTAGATTAGKIDQVKAHVSNPDGQCDFDVTGAVDANFATTGQKLNVTAGNVLTISNVSGCFGLINNGDTSDFLGSYTVTAAAGAITIS